MQPQSTAFTTLEDAAERGDAVRFWREQRYDGLECLSATFRQHRYVPHTHETYAIAAVLDGCEVFNHRGVRNYAHPGSFAVVCPDELHDGEPLDRGFVYRVLYPTVDLMRAIAEDAFGKPVSGTPWFDRSVVHDPELAGELAKLQVALRDSEVTLLERDTLLERFFSAMLGRWGGLGEPIKLGNESGPIAKARDHLDQHFDRDVALDELAQVAGLNRSHLVRSFRKAMGTTPHAYLLDRRYRAARRLLAVGEGPAEVAAACGFCDQSHLNRVFKARMGVTPGAFRAQ
ncbi:helix-turn-helix domain-containing protein [Labrys okinawensis]|uniref:AraC family transcriptional regulator n=1 Tax=Labrys okinawensis TaxID=346911 RepID=UPI0039BCDD7D